MAESTSRNVMTFDLDEVAREIAEIDRAVREKMERRRHLCSVLALAPTGYVRPEGIDFVFDPTGSVSSCASPATPRVRAHSHRTMVLTVLEESPQPLGVRSILDGIEAKFGARLVRTSISPLLRKLARQKLVVHDPEAANWTVPRDAEVVEMNFRHASERETGS